jgi:hypothetical protein
MYHHFKRNQVPEKLLTADDEIKILEEFKENGGQIIDI